MIEVAIAMATVHCSGGMFLEIQATLEGKRRMCLYSCYFGSNIIDKGYEVLITKAGDGNNAQNKGWIKRKVCCYLSGGPWRPCYLGLTPN